jgi:phage I-like protein
MEVWMQKVNLRTVELNTATGPPSEFRLLPLGDYPTQQGTFNVDVDALERIIQEFKTRGNDLSIDYEHQSMDEARSGPVPAAGWIGGLEIRDDGLWAVNVNWTDTAQAHLEAREYRYYSPTFYVDGEDNIMAIDSPALTNRPASHKLQPLIASLTQARRDISMDKSNLLNLILTTLSMNTTESENDVVAAITELRELRRETLALTGTDSIAKAKGVLAAWKASHDKLVTVEAEKVTLQTQLEQNERESIIQAAEGEGKLTPAQTAEGGWAQTVELSTLKAFLETAPKVVELKHADEPTSKRVTLSDEEKAVAAQLGVPEDTFTKTSDDEEAN